MVHSNCWGFIILVNDTWNVEALELLPPYTYTGYYTLQHSRPFLSLEGSQTGPEACSYNGIVWGRAGVGEKDGGQGTKSPFCCV